MSSFIPTISLKPYRDPHGILVVPVRLSRRAERRANWFAKRFSLELGDVLGWLADEMIEASGPESHDGNAIEAHIYARKLPPLHAPPQRAMVVTHN